MPWFPIMVKSYINHQFCFTAFSQNKKVSLPVLPFIFSSFILLQLYSYKPLTWYLAAHVPSLEHHYRVHSGVVDNL
ncbi:hypothetical protein XENTR_v10008179 [Xenopus tropicalis]|nr:hypothetical protein XENTR_v10008179 [Xenopus tropicalis]